MITPLVPMMRDGMATRETVLVINRAMSAEQTSALLQGTAIVSAGFDTICAEFLARTKPDYILAPLLIGDLDILDIAEKLDGLGYQGVLLAVAPPLPNPRLIKAEVRALCPNLRFDVVLAAQPLV